MLPRIRGPPSATLRLQLGLDGFEYPEAHRSVVASERDHEAHSTMLGSVCITRQGADAGEGAGLEQGPVAAAEQGGMGLEEAEQLGKATSREAVAAADARAFLEVDGLGKAVPDEHLCGTFSAASAISTTLSVPKIIGALTWPMCAIRNALPSCAPSPRPSTTPHLSRQ